MSVVGVDLGSLNTVVAVARNRGVDVVSIPYTFEVNFLGNNMLIASRSQMKSQTAQLRKPLHAPPCLTPRLTSV